MAKKETEITDINQSIVERMKRSYEYRVKEFANYLDSLYINGSLIMLDTSDDIEAEHMEYGKNLGLSETECLELYDDYLARHEIGEKNDLLYAMLRTYALEGDFKENDMKELVGDMNAFWETEGKRFIMGVNELFQMQASFYEVMEKNELLPICEFVICEKAKRLGFRNKDYVNAIIKGNDIRWLRMNHLQ